MPIFKFRCKSCGEEFEDFRGIMEKDERGFCLSCGSREIERLEAIVSECDCGCGCGSAPDVNGCQGCD